MPYVRGLLSLFVASALLVSCTSDSDQTATPTASSSPTETSPASATASPTATPTQTATPTESPPPAEARPVTGLFTEPQTTEFDRERTVPPAPESRFAPWNGEDVVLYDTLTTTETNLGPGFISFPAFNPSGTRFAWTAGALMSGRIGVLDLDTGEQRDLGPGRNVWWLDEHTLYGFPQPSGNLRQRLDVSTGKWSDASDIDPNGPRGMDTSTVSRWTLERLRQGEYPFWSTTFRLTDRSGDLAPLVFEAYQAELAPDGALFVAVTPAEVVDPLPDFAGLQAGATNIFSVDPLTGEATFIASAEASAPNWAFAASERHVGWNDGFCADSDDRTILFDRSSGELTALDRAMWFEFTPDGRIADGAFGARRLIDPETLDTTVVLPEPIGDVAWSPDYRYAAVGTQHGHGGLCGG